MKCPYCSYGEDKVIDSDLPMKVQQFAEECLSCHKRYTTYEKVSLPIRIKKDGSRQPYDREKVRKGILRACEKRTISINQIENILDVIEGQISNSLEREVTSEFIGELVMEKLRDLDEVAYVRVASVYRQFKDINTFMNELNKLLLDK